ncbi:hypothetical protein JW979_11545 [bacterium]|nr:hypothetical protein [candidate division CSSED10-310 bacterium]
MKQKFVVICMLVISCHCFSADLLKQAAFDDREAKTPGLSGSCLTLIPQTTETLNLSNLSFKDHSGAVSIWIYWDKKNNLNTAWEFFVLDFPFRNESLVCFADCSRVAIRLRGLADGGFYDVNLPVFYLSLSGWCHFLVEWDFESVDQSRFLSLRINGNREGVFYSFNDTPSDRVPRIPDIEVDGRLTFLGPPENPQANGQGLFDSCRIFDEPLTDQEICQVIEQDYGALPRLVYEAEMFRHFMGKKITDPDARDQKSWTTDPSLLKTAVFNSPEGDIDLALRVRCTMNQPPDQPVVGISVSDSNNNVLMEWILTRKDLGETYQTFTKPFRIETRSDLTIAVDMKCFGYHDFFLDWIQVSMPDKQLKWSWRDMERIMGSEIDDSDAMNGKAWTNAHALIFGPYTKLPMTGSYTAVFRIKIASDLQGTNLATMDVCAHDGFLGPGKRGNKSYGMHGLDTGMFRKPGIYQEFTVPFLYDGAEMMEFRVLSYRIGHGEITVDQVVIEKKL